MPFIFPNNIGGRHSGHILAAKPLVPTPHVRQGSDDQAKYLFWNKQNNNSWKNWKLLRSQLKLLESLSFNPACMICSKYTGLIVLLIEHKKLKAKQLCFPTQFPWHLAQFDKYGRSCRNQVLLVRLPLIYFLFPRKNFVALHTKCN